MGRLLPLLATLFVGAAHTIAWRATTPTTVWMAIAIAYVPLLVMALTHLRREEALADSFMLVAGDISRGLGGAAVALLFTWMVAYAAMRAWPGLVARDLQGLLWVRNSVPSEGKRALAIVSFAVIEEIVWRGAVTHSLESRVGSQRAPWFASALFVLVIIPSLHPSMMVAAVALGAVTAFLLSRYQRLFPVLVAHAAFTWLVLELMLPYLWQQLRTGLS